MYDSWRYVEPAGGASLPTGQHPQLINQAWRIRNMSENQGITNGSSTILGPEVVVAQDSSGIERQECDELAPALNSELVIGEEDCDQTVDSSISLLSSPSLPQDPCDQTRCDFTQSMGSMASPVAASSHALNSISHQQMADETEAGSQRPSDGALPVTTGSCGISYADGHAMGLEVNVGDEKSGYMNLRHKSRRKPVQDRPRPKRQAARDMCRPLKQWLYCHRDTPYPTKAEKQDLALLSRMTLTQVSNWFANARRRLKNTVSGSEVTWRRRIKLYNQFVVGNQELLSISSEDTMWDEDDDDDEEEELEDGRVQERSQESALNASPRLIGAHQMSSLLSSSGIVSQSETTDRRHRLSRFTFDPEAEDLSRPAAAASPSGASCTPAAKFKQGILQRYLTDAYDRVGQKGVNEEGDMGEEETESDGRMEEEAEASERRHRRHRNGSGSLSSHDYEEMSLSARSTPTKEHQTNEDDIVEDQRCQRDTHPCQLSSSNDPDDLYWMEISAALALTNLAMRSRLNSGSSHDSSHV